MLKHILNRSDQSCTSTSDERQKGFSVEYYRLPNGSYPAEDFILSLDYKMQAKVFRLLMLLEEYGNLLHEPYSKHVDDGIFELRARQGNDTARVLYFFVTGRKAILTNGFIKKTQKTPKEEIELAKKYRSDYFLTEDINE